MTRVVHRAALISEAGVSALCFEMPKAIDMRVASWTMQDDGVTCRKCLDAMATTKHAEDS